MRETGRPLAGGERSSRGDPKVTRSSDPDSHPRRRALSQSQSQSRPVRSLWVRSGSRNCERTRERGGAGGRGEAACEGAIGRHAWAQGGVDGGDRQWSEIR